MTQPAPATAAPPRRFQLPNLTIHIQATVKPSDIGVASAMIQTMRMLGSMVGATMVGVWVQHGFFSQVQTMLAQNPAPPAATHLFSSPQILMQPLNQAASQIDPALFARLLEGARAALIHGVHNAFTAALCLAIVAAAVAWWLPPLRLYQEETTTGLAEK